MKQTQLDRIEQKLDRLLAERDIDPNPGVIIEAGERFAPGTGRIPPVANPEHPARYDLGPHLAEARRTLRATPTDANPGTSTEDGRTFTPGSGPIAEFKPPPDQPAVNPAAFVAQARRALTPNPTGDGGFMCPGERTCRVCPEHQYSEPQDQR